MTALGPGVRIEAPLAQSFPHRTFGGVQIGIDEDISQWADPAGPAG